MNWDGTCTWTRRCQSEPVMIIRIKPERPCCAEPSPRQHEYLCEQHLVHRYTSHTTCNNCGQGYPMIKRVLSMERL